MDEIYSKVTPSLINQKKIVLEDFGVPKEKITVLFDGKEFTSTVLLDCYCNRIIQNQLISECSI